MIWITIAFLLIIEIFSWVKYHDLLCPAVLSNIMWIISIIFAIKICPKEYLNSSYFIVIIMGAIVFQIGFSMSLKTKIKKRREVLGYDIVIKKINIKILVGILTIFLIPIFVQYFQYMKSTNLTFYEMLTTAEDNLNLPSLFNYYRKIIQFICLVVVTVYWNTSNNNKKVLKKYVRLLLIISILCVLSVPTRNGILFFLLPFVFVYLLTHEVSNKKIAIIGIITIICFMIIFYNISLEKYWYLYDSSKNKLDVIINEFSLYLSGGVVAFIETAKNHSFTYFGQNTFRFFYAIFDKLFNTTSSVDLVNEFTKINSSLTTNVYTFYDFYLRDFGILYAIFIQFIVSILHGISYKGACKKSPFQIYLFSMLSYPLIMQFFQDQYFSLTSTWIQIILVGIIMIKTNLFFIIKPIYKSTKNES